MQTLTIFTDGGARGNPGPAGIGAVIYDAEQNELGSLSEYLGKATNNVAEYTAIVRALSHVATLVDDTKAYHVTLKLDSQLAQRQLIGEYKVKDATLREYYDQVKELEAEFASVEYIHVRREENKVADKLVNEALDAA
jgi:ribonuclease HI